MQLISKKLVNLNVDIDEQKAALTVETYIFNWRSGDGWYMTFIW